jgi:glutathione S-transferase
MQTLWLVPGACSLAVHITLEELGVPFDTHLIPQGGARTSEALFAVNPRRRVPVLETNEGILTETTAILVHLAESHPERALFPAQPSSLATRVRALMSFLATGPHPTFSHVLSPCWVDEAGARDVRERALTEYDAALRHADTVLAGLAADEGPYALGAYSVLDPYVTVFELWARYARLDTKQYPRLSAIARATLARPASRRALEREGLAKVV